MFVNHRLSLKDGAALAQAKKDQASAAAARRLLVEHTLKTQPGVFSDDRARDAFENYSKSIDQGSVADRFKASRGANTPARKAEKARLEQEIKDATKEVRENQLHCVFVCVCNVTAKLSY